MLARGRRVLLFGQGDIVGYTPEHVGRRFDYDASRILGQVALSKDGARVRREAGRSYAGMQAHAGRYYSLFCLLPHLLTESFCALLNLLSSRGQNAATRPITHEILS